MTRYLVVKILSGAAMAITLLLFYSCLTWLITEARNDTDGLSVAEIVRLRGFIAEEHNVTTDDGYILNVVRVLNPLINSGLSGAHGKRPIIFIHGETAAGSVYVLNSANVVGPKDYTNTINSRETTIETMNELFKDDPLSHSLAFLASSFGHEAWILNRRGNPFSQLHVKYEAFRRGNGSERENVTDACASGNPDEPGDYDANSQLAKILASYGQHSFGAEYWSYSQDEQAKYDVPNTIDYVLGQTRSDKVALVGHSSGSAIIMMMLATKPEMDSKISNTIHLAPSMYQPHSTAPLKYKAAAVGPALSPFVGPFSITQSTQQVQCLVSRACNAKFSKKVCANGPAGPPAGRTGNNMDAMAAFSKHSGYAVSARQMVQLVVQQKQKGKLHFYDYGSASRNIEAYGRPDAPVYDVSKINSSTMSFWYGQFDTSATPNDIALLISDLRVPVKNHYFNQWDLYFDHSSPVFHENVATLVVIPALKEIESYEFPIANLDS